MSKRQSLPLREDETLSMAERVGGKNAFKKNGNLAVCQFIAVRRG